MISIFYRRKRSSNTLVSTMSLSHKISSPSLCRQVRFAEALVLCKKEDDKMIQTFLLTQKQLPFESTAELQQKIINEFRKTKCGVFENMVRWSAK